MEKSYIMKKTDCTIKILYESDFCNSISRISLQSDKPWVQRAYYAWRHILSFCVCVAKLCGMQQDPGSLTRNQTHSSAVEGQSPNAWPPGSPPYFLSKRWIIFMCKISYVEEWLWTFQSSFWDFLRVQWLRLWASKVGRGWG